MRRELFLVIGILLATASAATAAERLPNIVFILADDMGQGDLGCYNPESKAPTPHMDSLAAQGVRFSDAHSPSAVCTPTRYGLLTGRFCWRSRLKTGVLWGFSRALIEPDRLTIASMLKEHGYHTGGFGKWHLGLGPHDPANPKAKTDYAEPLVPGPTSVGFDTYFGIPASLDMEPYVWVENDHVVEQPTARTPGSKRWWAGGEGFWRAGPTAPSFRHVDVLPTITQKAVDYIGTRATAEPNRPFFMYVPLSAPHTPWLPTKAFRGRSEAGVYGDFVTQCDATVGQVAAALERHGMADNTLLIVSSDNGSHWRPEDIHEFGHEANNHRRGMKADVHEGGHRVPFLARWVGKIKPGTVCNQPICLTDMVATAAAIVGHQLPDDAAEDSFNILPNLLGGPNAGADRPVVNHSMNGTFALRRGKWKLILGLGSGGFTQPSRVKPKAGGPIGQLYDLEQDPAEQHNLWQQRPEVVERMRAELEQIRNSGRSRPAAG